MTDTRDSAHALWPEIGPRLRAYLHVLLGNLADADDILQDVSVIFLAQNPQRDVEPWLFTVARNLALNTIRARRRRERREAAHAIPPPLSEPHAEAERREALERLQRCLYALTDDIREMLYLNVAEDRSLSDLATLLQIPRSTVAARIQEGLIALNRCFAGEHP